MLISGHGLDPSPHIVFIEFDYLSVHIVEGSDFIIFNPLGEAFPDPRLDHI